MKLTNIILIAVLSVVSLTANAKRGMSNEHMLLSERAAEYLSLTQDQQSQIKSVFEQQKSALEQYKEVGKEMHQQRKELIHNTSFDEHEFRDLITNHQDTKLEIAVIKARGKNQIWNLLNEDQQEKLTKIMKHRMNKMHNGRKVKHHKIDTQ
ncbi:Spy/CpxP family protein refolding chaperone [Pseudoalteromonas denitrificans]|uniref:Protein CpxP n=1 Tax=Pseudoalteromonas denitrificans DSM 6059 TaxID=1123010 RepID=A0A1I1NYM6_9GAMM|nr:Spy/CpxP family protein refolding chaperone [Pseudoalteromonas denitrificans]SFD02794.1 protein CpxP [Pseudoalteromonas denitrificans DSM 6059]